MTTPVYEWQLSDGAAFGLGTATEFAYWQSQGTIPDGAKLGDVLCHEPSSEDERRKLVWAA